MSEHTFRHSNAFLRCIAPACVAGLQYFNTCPAYKRAVPPFYDNRGVILISAPPVCLSAWTDKQNKRKFYVIAYWGTVNGLRAGRSSVRTPSEARNFSLLQNISTGSVAHPASYWIDTWVLSWVMGRGVKLTTHLQLVLRWRLSGAIPLLPQDAFIAWTEAA